MEALLQLRPRRANLLLHCGAQAVDREITGATPTPELTATWTPLPHMALIEEVEGVLKSNGLSVVNQAHSLTHDGLRYFGLMAIQNGVIHRDYAWVLGLRNSHDKTSDSSAHDLIIRSTDVRACTPRQIPLILKEWRNPRHEQFQARTLWSLFNSFTESSKRKSE